MLQALKRNKTKQDQNNSDDSPARSVGIVTQHSKSKQLRSNFGKQNTIINRSENPLYQQQEVEKETNFTPQNMQPEINLKRQKLIKDLHTRLDMVDKMDNKSIYDELGLFPVHKPIKKVKKNKYEIVNSDPLKPNLITEGGNNTYQLSTHTFYYFYSIVRGRDSPFRLTIQKKGNQNPISIKGYISMKSIQPNQFNSEYIYDGKSFSVHAVNRSKQFHNQHIYFSLVTNCEAVLEFKINFGEIQLPHSVQANLNYSQEEVQEKIVVGDISESLKFLMKKYGIPQESSSQINRQDFTQSNMATLMNSTHFDKMDRIFRQRSEKQSHRSLVILNNQLQVEKKRLVTLEMHEITKQRKNNRVQTEDIIKNMAKKKLWAYFWIYYIKIIEVYQKILENFDSYKLKKYQQLRKQQRIRRVVRKLQKTIKRRGPIDLYKGTLKPIQELQMAHTQKMQLKMEQHNIQQKFPPQSKFIAEILNEYKQKKVIASVLDIQRRVENDFDDYQTFITENRRKIQSPNSSVKKSSSKKLKSIRSINEEQQTIDSRQKLDDPEIPFNDYDRDMEVDGTQDKDSGKIQSQQYMYQNNSGLSQKLLTRQLVQFKLISNFYLPLKYKKQVKKKAGQVLTGFLLDVSLVIKLAGRISHLDNILYNTARALKQQSILMRETLPNFFEQKFDEVFSDIILEINKANYLEAFPNDIKGLNREFKKEVKYKVITEKEYYYTVFMHYKKLMKQRYYQKMDIYLQERRRYIRNYKLENRRYKKNLTERDIELPMHIQLLKPSVYVYPTRELWIELSIMLGKKRKLIKTYTTGEKKKF